MKMQEESLDGGVVKIALEGRLDIDGTPQTDDIALLVLRYPGPGSAQA